MAGIKIDQSIDICEVDNIETSTVECPSMTISSHPDNNDMVIIGVGARTYTVSGSELMTACDNAMTTER